MWEPAPVFVAKAVLSFYIFLFCSFLFMMGGHGEVMDGLGVDNLNDAPGNNAARTVVHSATIKLSPFYPVAPGFWFSQAESQFRLKKI